MKRVLLFLLATCMLLTFAGCSVSDKLVTAIVSQRSAESTEVTTAPTADTHPSLSAPAESGATPNEEATVPPAETTIPPAETTVPETTEPTATDGSYLVKIWRKNFPIYDGPGYDYYPVRIVEVATAYTIVEESLDEEGNLWGKLKSGAGWVDLSLNARESVSMPSVTVSRKSQQLLSDGNYYYCSADRSQYSYDIVFLAHETLTDVSFFTIDPIDNYKRGTELYSISRWEPSKPLVASVTFPGPASVYGLECTDSRGNTRVYSVWESGRNGSVGISLLDVPLDSPAKDDPVSLPSMPNTLHMTFSSGAGAWSTGLTLYKDGSFTGHYSDSDMGDFGPDYPNGSCYICDFEGKFRITGTDSYAIKLSLDELELADYGAEEWISDQIRYIASDAYGISDGTNFLLYMPDTPVSQLPESAFMWGHDLPESGAAGYYILYCLETGTAFYS